MNIMDFSVVSIVLNFILVLTTIFFALLAHKNAQLVNKQKKIDELSDIDSKLKRIVSFEHTRIIKNSNITYGILIREGILTTDLVDSVVSKCNKYDLQTSELEDFQNKANGALANKKWDSSLAGNLVSAAQKLSSTLQPHVTNCSNN